MTREEFDLSQKLINICESYENRSHELKMLIILGADVHYAGNMALFKACQVGNLEYIKILRESKIHDEQVSKAVDERLLIDACEYNHLHIVKYLIEERTVDVNVNCGHPLYSAIRIGNIKLIEYLISRGGDPKTLVVREFIKKREKNIEEMYKKYKEAEANQNLTWNFEP